MEETIEIIEALREANIRDTRFLKEANERNEKLQEELQDLKNGIKDGIDSLKDKHKAFLGTKGQEHRDSFKLGLSWGWEAFEDLIEDE